jgi:hypothetical protein
MVDEPREQGRWRRHRVFKAWAPPLEPAHGQVRVKEPGHLAGLAKSIAVRRSAQQLREPTAPAGIAFEQRLEEAPCVGHLKH